jgi:hypothetical protein
MRNGCTQNLEFSGLWMARIERLCACALMLIEKSSGSAVSVKEFTSNYGPRIAANRHFNALLGATRVSYFQSIAHDPVLSMG